jgi:hypothetical protein
MPTVSGSTGRWDLLPRPLPPRHAGHRPGATAPPPALGAAPWCRPRPDRRLPGDLGWFGDHRLDRHAPQPSSTWSGAPHDPGRLDHPGHPPPHRGDAPGPRNRHRPMARSTLEGLCHPPTTTTIPPLDAKEVPGTRGLSRARQGREVLPSSRSGRVTRAMLVEHSRQLAGRSRQLRRLGAPSLKGHRDLRQGRQMARQSGQRRQRQQRNGRQHPGRPDHPRGGEQRPGRPGKRDQPAL